MILIRRRPPVLFTVLALLLAACSTSGDGGAGGADAAGGSGPAPGAAEGGDTTGVTDDTIRIGAMINDNDELAEIGFAVDIGDTEAQFRTLFERIESHGRTVELVPVPFSSITAETQREACLRLTQDEEVFLVTTLGGTSPETVLCVTEENETLFLSGNAQSDEIFERSGGRFFSTTLSFNAGMEAAVRALDDRGELEGRTIGVVLADSLTDRGVVDDALVPALEELGYEVAAEATLPCNGAICDQHEAAAQQLKDAGVDAVFTTVNMVSWTSFVAAAESIEFEPQWFSTVIGNHDADVLARRMEANASFDGALAVTTAPRGWTVEGEEPPTFGQQCNDDYAEATGDEHVWGNDQVDSGWGAVASICSFAAITQLALDATGEDLTRERFVEAMESLTDVPVNNIGDVGAFAPDKHYAAEAVNILEFDSGCNCWVATDHEPIPLG